MGRDALTLACLGAGEGLLLGRGLELCFGVGQYRLIMLFGVLGGLGLGLLGWVGRAAWDRAGGGWRSGWRLTAAGGGTALLVFAGWALLRVLPLIREELSYSL